jgi:hypothetical protein
LGIGTQNTINKIGRLSAPYLIAGHRVTRIQLEMTFEVPPKLSEVPPTPRLNTSEFSFEDVSLASLEIAFKNGLRLTVDFSRES